MNSIRIGRVISAMAVTAALAACGNMQPTPAPATTIVTPAPIVIEKPKLVDTGCDWNDPITVDTSVDKISPATADQILAHNREGAKRCGWKGKSAAPATPATTK